MCVSVTERLEFKDYKMVTEVNSSGRSNACEKKIVLVIVQLNINI